MVVKRCQVPSKVFSWRNRFERGQKVPQGPEPFLQALGHL